MPSDAASQKKMMAYAVVMSLPTVLWQLGLKRWIFAIKQENDSVQKQNCTAVAVREGAVVSISRCAGQQARHAHLLAVMP
jgi:hypothetical protein